MDQDNGHEPVSDDAIQKVVKLIPKAKLEAPTYGVFAAKMLQDFLDMVAKGDVVAVSVAAVQPDGGIVTGRMGGESAHTMTAAITTLLHRHMQQVCND